MHMCVFDARPHECGNSCSQGRLNLVPALPAASFLLSPPASAPRLEESLRQYRFAPRVLRRDQGGAWGNKASAGATSETRTRTLTQTKGLQF